MFIVKAIDEKENLVVQQANCMNEKEVEWRTLHFNITLPYCKVKVEEKLPWTKERAEKEIEEKAKRFGVANPLDEKPKKSRKKKSE